MLTCPRPAPLFLALAAALSTGLAFAAPDANPDASADASARIKNLDSVTVIGNHEDPQGTTGSAYVLTGQDLGKFTRSNVHDILRSVPGVYVREENGIGFFPRIGVRASSSGRSNRISILEDGIPAAMAPYANNSAYYFPNVARISSIEVLKGPEVLLHGPQTTSGVINLVSTPIPNTAQGHANIEIGAFDTRKIHLNYGASVGQWGFLLETYQAESDGPFEIERSKRTSGYDINEYVGKLRWSSAEDARYQQQFDLKLHYDVEYGDISYVGQTDADFREDPNRRYGLSELERMDRGRRSASARYHFAFNDNHWLDTTAYWMRTYRYYKRVNQINGINLGAGATGNAGRINIGAPGSDLIRDILHGADTTHANGIRYGNNHQHFTVKGLQVESHNLFNTGTVAHELISGIRYSRETPENAVKRRGNIIYHQINGSLVWQSMANATPSKGEVKALEAWIGDRINFGNVTLLPVIRHERIDTKANLVENASTAQIAARASNELDKTTFGLGATWALNDQWTLLGGIHEGFAAPGNGVARGTKGEESLNFEFGVRYREQWGGVDVVAFYSDYDNALRQCLFANPCTNPVSGGDPITDGSTQQDGSKKVQGLELSAFADLYQSGDFSVPLRFSYTYTDSEYTGSADLTTGVQKGDVMEYTPEHVASLQVGLEGVSGFSTHLALNYTDSSWTSNTAKRAGVDNRFLSTQSLFTVDLVTAYQLSDAASVYARVDNLFDEQRITHRGADGARGNAPRWVSFGLKYQF